MKKVKLNRKSAAFLAAVLVAAAAAVFAGGIGIRVIPKPPAADDIENKLRISVIMPHNNDGYWSRVLSGCEDAGRQYHSRVDVKTYFPQLNYNIDQMTTLIRRQTAAKVDAIIVQGNDNGDYRQALTEASREGIRIVLVDTDIRQDFVPHLYIGTDNEMAGADLGRLLIKLTGGQANVAILSGEEGYSNLEERCLGVKEAVAGCPGIRLLSISYDHYDTMTVINQIHRIQTELPEADTLLCLEGTAGQTLGEQFGPEEKPFPHIIAFDDTEGTLKGVRSGVIDAVVVQQPYEMGRLAVECVAKQSDICKTLHTGIQWITPETLRQQEEHGQE